MSRLKYYYQINAQTREPIQGSNIKTNRPPKSNGSTQWVEITTVLEYCCDDESVPKPLISIDIMLD